MANVIHVTVENPDELLNAGMYDAGAIVRLQSGAAEAGPFANESTATITAATRAYTLYDADGASSTWYRTRYENALGTSFSDWSDPFQVGAEEAGQICSIYDVEQRLTGSITPGNREILTGFIRDATSDIENYCRRWFIPRPLNGTATYLFTPRRDGRILTIPKGIRSVTALGYASTDQPDTGGTYTAITASDAVLQPGVAQRDVGWPATSIHLLSTSGGYFYCVLNGVQVTGAFGFAAPPAEISGIGANMVIRRFTARGSGVAMAAGSEDFTGRILRWCSPEEHDKLDSYRYLTV